SQALISPVVSEPFQPPSEQREPEPVARDQVQLDADPDVGPGPGDTRVLPAEKASDKPRKVPTLKARLIEAETPKEAAPTAEETSVVDDALGLTPEARRREHAKAEDL